MSGATADGYWVLEARPFHVECAPWHDRDYPFVWAVDEARRVLSAFRAAGKPLPDAFARAHAWLETASSRWPGVRPVQLVRSSVKAVQVVEQTRRELEASRA